MVWAIVSGCTAATNSPGGLLTVRFFLGLVEAPFFPGAIYYLSCWYTKRELGIRMALLVCGIPLSNAFAGLISSGILSGMNGVGKLAAWRWLFILEGSATILLGIVALFVLPDYPNDTKWLSEEEKIVAQGRLAKDIGSDDVLGEDNVSIWKGIQWAAKDPRVWIIATMQMANTASISFSHFFPTLIKELGFKDNTTTLLLTSPPYVFAFIWAISFAFDADRRQTRSPHAAISILLALTGSIFLIALPQKYKWERYFFTFFECAGTFGVYSTTYTWLSSTIPRPPMKRAAAIGIANSLANMASLFGNYFWLDKYLPSYRQSWACIIAFESLAFCCIILLRTILLRENKRFDRIAAEINPNDAAAIAALDEDEQRAVVSNFRYVI
jgi:MFS family permease